jgi:hypothetical protein
MATFPMRFTDRSRIVRDWECPRARYLGYELDGKGIAPSSTSLELWLGTALHDGLAALARSQPGGASIDEIASAVHAQVYDALAAVPVGEVPDADTRTFAAEQAALVEGLVRGFYRQVWPRLLAEGWRIVAVEQEVSLPLGANLTFMSKPDLVIASPDDEWWYVEYKSTSSKKAQWVDSWSTAVQLHSGCKAVEATLGHPVAGVIVQGLYKGYESYGRQNSPFCYAYVRAGQPPFRQEEVRYDYASGFRRQPVWERPGGVREWVAGMPDDILTDQFPQTPPIFLKEELVDGFLKQVEAREAEIADAHEWIAEHPEDREDIMAKVFPQHFDKCQPAWGRGCSFKRICHGRVEDPLTSGFSWREPHHTPELEAQDAASHD